MSNSKSAFQTDPQSVTNDTKFCSETLRGKFATCHITIMSTLYFPAFTEHVEDAHELFWQILIDAV